MPTLTPSKFAKNFGKRKCPPELLALLSFQNAGDGFFCEGFELATGFDAASTYAPASDEREVVVFARTGDDSEYAFWVEKKAKTFARAPVVFLDSEGVTNLVVARDVKELLGLLALDQENPATWRSAKELAAERATSGDAPTARAAEYRAWLKDRGLAPIKNPGPTVRRAQKAFPGFEAWLRPEVEAPAAAVPMTLKQACDAGLLEVVKQHLAAGDARSQLDALEAAIYRDHAQVVSAFLDAGVPVDAAGDYGSTLLHTAATYLSVESAKVLLERGAKAGQENDFGETPLQKARTSEMQTPGAAEHKEALIALLSARR